MSANPNDPYLNFYLDALADKVFNTYRRNRENGVFSKEVKPIDVSNPPNSVHNKFYKYFVNDIFNSTGVLLSSGLLFKLLGRKYVKIKTDSTNSFEEISIETFEKYSLITQTPQGKIFLKGDDLRLKGVTVIDFIFYRRIENDKKELSKEDFYLSKK